MFITLEGIDGSGKSTLSSIVTERLKEKGLDVLFVNRRSPPKMEGSVAISRLC